MKFSVLFHAGWNLAKKISVSDGVKSDVAKESRIAQCCVCRCLPQLDQRIYPTPDPLNEIIKDEPEQHHLHHPDNESAFYWDFLQTEERRTNCVCHIGTED